NPVAPLSCHCQGSNHSSHCSHNLIASSITGANQTTGNPSTNNSDKGTMHQAKTGISNQFAKGDSTPQLPNHQAPKAPTPKESINCARHQLNFCPTVINTNKANTALKDNQKLGSTTLNGAHSKTPKQA